MSRNDTEWLQGETVSLGQDFATVPRSMPTPPPWLFGLHSETDFRDAADLDFGAFCLRLKTYPFCNGSNRPEADSWLLVTRQCDVLDRVHLNSAERRLMLL